MTDVIAKRTLETIPIVPATEEVALYEIRKKIYPRAVHGAFARWRWAVIFATQIVYYGLPWLTWNGRQAVLFDLGARKFYIGGLVFWPQDVIYLAVLLILAALALFLFTTIAGRIWCGYACPQTVYTEIFLWIERKIEGDRLARIRLDAAPFSLEKLVIKGLKHSAWLAVALWTGYTFVGYFSPIREVGIRAITWQLGAWEAFWMVFYAVATWGNAGFMREQVCKYMCPYARFQSVMFDKDTLVITYDTARGEPRGLPAKGRAAAAASPFGDCIDCKLCVQVCPTGIDIRQGLQYECIGCGLCVDACNIVMDKMTTPRGLIRYATQNSMAGRWTPRQVLRRVLRPRVLVYTAVLAALCVGLLASLVTRTPLKVDVVRDRASLARIVEGGQLENVYRLQIMNTAETARTFEITATGLPALEVAGTSRVELAGTASRMVPVRLRVPAGAAAGTHRIEFAVTAVGDEGVAVREKSVFIVR